VKYRSIFSSIFFCVLPMQINGKNICCAVMNYRIRLASSSTVLHLILFDVPFLARLLPSLISKSIVFDIDILYFLSSKIPKTSLFWVVIEYAFFFTFFSEIDFLYFLFCNICKFVILIVLVQISCPLRSNCTANSNRTKRCVITFNVKWIG